MTVKNTVEPPHNSSEATVSPDQEIDTDNDVDQSLIEYNLSLTREERLINHERARETINELKKATTLIYGEPDPSSQASS